MTANSGTSTFNNITVNGIVTGSVTANAGTATALETARNIGGVSFDGTADIDLPGVNTAGNQDTSGTAAKATQVKVTEDANSSTTYYVYFGESGGGGTQRDVKSDNNVFSYQPSSNKLSVGEVACSSIGTAGNTTFGTSSQNAYGARTISQNNPSGGSDGDIWYKY